MKNLLNVTILALIIGGLIVTNQLQTARSSIDNADTLQTAAVAYEEGQFAEAAAAYQQMVDSGVRNSHLYYNLGNAYLKQEEVGQAILNYRRATRLDPRDADLRANLALAELQTKDQLDSSGDSFIHQLASQSEQWATMNEMALLALIWWFLLMLCLLAYRHTDAERWQEGLQYAMFGLICLLLVTTIPAACYVYIESSQPAAIIMAEKVDVHSGPNPQFLVEFSLHQGTEVRLLERRDGWARLTLPGNQLQGWVAASEVMVIGEGPALFDVVGLLASRVTRPPHPIIADRSVVWNKGS